MISFYSEQTITFHCESNFLLNGSSSTYWNLRLLWRISMRFSWVRWHRLLWRRTPWSLSWCKVLDRSVDLNIYHLRLSSSLLLSNLWNLREPKIEKLKINKLDTDKIFGNITNFEEGNKRYMWNWVIMSTVEATNVFWLFPERFKLLLKLSSCWTTFKKTKNVNKNKIFLFKMFEILQ